MNNEFFNQQNIERLITLLGTAVSNAVSSNRSSNSDADRDGGVVMRTEKMLVKLIARECPAAPDKRQAWLNEIGLVLDTDASGVRWIERGTELQCWKVDDGAAEEQTFIFNEVVPFAAVLRTQLGSISPHGDTTY